MRTQVPERQKRETERCRSFQSNRIQSKCQIYSQAFRLNNAIYVQEESFFAFLTKGKKKKEVMRPFSSALENNQCLISPP